MRKLLLQLLFRLLDKSESYANIDEEAIQEWLANQATTKGFKEYIRKRDLQLLKTLGVGLTEENNRIWLGQRYELLRLYQIATETAKKDATGKKPAGRRRKQLTKKNYETKKRRTK
ncbi:MAG: hypothetical protein WC261_09510 [Synergistaceae bacterium]|jgi:hypothetical protein